MIFNFLFGGGVDFPNFRKPEYVWMNPVRCICTKFHVGILKNCTVLLFWRSKRAIFTLVPAISVFYRSSKFVRFGPFKGCSRVIFAFLMSTWPKNMYHAAQTQNFQSGLSLTFMTLTDPDLEYANRKLSMILRSVPGTIHVVVLTYFYLIRL